MGASGAALCNHPSERRREAGAGHQVHREPWPSSSFGHQSCLATSGANLKNQATLNGSVATLNGSVASLNCSPATLNDSLVTLKGFVATLNGSVASLNGSMATLNGSVATINGSVTSDNPRHDEGDDSELGKEEWPVHRVLPFPKWGCERPELQFATVQQYQGFQAQVSRHLYQALAAHCYDTVSNFIVFGQEYLKYREEYPQLLEFFRSYRPPLLPGHLNCVGLTADLAYRLYFLEPLYPGVQAATYQVSNEDSVVNMKTFRSPGDPPAHLCVMDHVLLCVRLRVAGRRGVMLMDPSFHVAEPITVMEDGLAPQSGVIKASTTHAEIQRTFHYSFWSENPAYVLWDIFEKREGKPVTKCPCVIYVCKPYLSGVDTAERCNLVFPFKTLLRRNSRGQLTSGLYFPIQDCCKTTITIFHQVDGLVRHLKHPLSRFLDEAWREEAVEEALAAVAAATDQTTSSLRATIVTAARLLQDKDMVQQMMAINNAIFDIGR